MASSDSCPESATSSAFCRIRKLVGGKEIMFYKRNFSYNLFQCLCSIPVPHHSGFWCQLSHIVPKVSILRNNLTFYSLKFHITCSLNCHWTNQTNYTPPTLRFHVSTFYSILGYRELLSATRKVGGEGCGEDSTHAFFDWPPWGNQIKRLTPEGPATKRPFHKVCTANGLVCVQIVWLPDCFVAVPCAVIPSIAYSQMEFLVVCDVKKLSDDICDELNSVPVVVQHVISAKKKNAADEKLRQVV